MSINIKYGNIESLVGSIITFDRPVKFLQAGMVIQNMKTGTFTKIEKVISSTRVELISPIGFASNTTVQIQSNLFDGTSLMRYLPRWLHNDDLEDFLNIFAEELQSQWEAIGNLPTLVDPDTCPEDLLPTLARSYDSPINADNEEEIKRNFIKVIQYGYKNKGSRLGLQAAFRSLGYDIVVKEYFFGKYVNVIDSVDGDTITLVSAGSSLPTTNGTFKPDDMICQSTGVGSNDPINNPGNWMLVKRVLGPYEYELYGGYGAGLTAGMNIVTFAYNESTRVADDNDFDDVATNEFPLMSSFIKVFITDRRPVALELTPEILSNLQFYLNIFKSSHARLRGAGIERETIAQADFRTDRMLAYYRFEESSYSGSTGDVSDSSNKEYDGTSHNLASTSSGKLTRGATFNGSSSYIETLKVFPTNEGTISIWFNSVGVNETLIGSQETGSPDQNLYLGFDGSGDFKWALGTKSGTFSVSGAGWHQVIMTWDEDSIRVYIDGELEDSDTRSGTLPSLPLYIGALNSDSSADEFYGGDIDEVEIWDSSFNTLDILDFYNSGSGRIFDPTTILELPRGPIARMDVPWATKTFVIDHGTGSSHALDTGEELDDGLFLDETDFMSTSVTIIFESDSISYSESLSLSEEYTVEEST